MVEKEKTLELKKHVAAIHSSNKLSLIQRKIANALLFNAYDDLLIKEEYQIHIRTLCNLIGYDSNDSKTIKKGLVNLLSTVIEWNLVDGNRLDAEGVWNASSIIADASIDGPICTYSYSNKMKKLLYCPELYGRVNMLVQAKFQSSYGLALYENCIRFQNIEQTPWFEIPKFRKLMGVEDGKYAIFRDFKRRVLDKAIEEVNKYSPITLDPKYQKKGRNVVAIQFLIRHSQENNTKSAENAPEVVSLSQQLKLDFGFSKAQIDETLTQYDEHYILEKIGIVESSPSFIQGKIANLAKYLLSALAEDYQPSKSSQTKVKAVKATRERAVKQTEERQTQSERTQVAYRRYQDKEILVLVNQLTAAAKKKIMKEFEKYLGKSLYFDIYKRDGIANILIADQLCDFVRAKKTEWLVDISSFNDFVNTAEKVKETAEAVD